MLDKKILLMLGFLFVIIILVIFFMRGPQKVGTMNTLKVGSHTYSVEIADTLVKQARGLGGRTGLAENSGMLFVFSSASMQAFWMKDMQFELDFVWIDHGKVIGVTENVPPVPQTAIDSPPSPADMVLEVAAGTVARDGIKQGDAVELQ